VKLKAKFLSLLLVLSFLVSFIVPGTHVQAADNNQLKVHFIDVGQADAILVQQGSNTMLIDGGNNADGPSVKNYIANLGINQIDVIVGTHAHEDHIGGLSYVINAFQVGKIYFPKQTSTTKTFENFVMAAKNKGLTFTAPVVGETFKVGNATCTILAPNGTSYSDSNDYSIVLKVQYGSNSFLLTGDAEAVSEKEMLNKELNLKADVLKVSHHGSRSSTTDAFLNAVNPKYAIISVGKDNNYGHPTTEVLTRLNNRGIATYRTDLQGTIIATSNGSSISFNTNPSGGGVVVKNGWIQENGKWYYYLNNNLKTGWLADGGKWYFMNSNGAMATGWVADGGYWYYLNSSGAMATGWIQSGGKWYYLYGNGQMAKSTIIGGYKLGADGAWIR
jgi:competence protein ComEC